MRVLLDTHVMIWWLEGHSRLPVHVRDIVNDRNNEIHFSIASVWEIAIKTSLGKLHTPGDLPEQMAANEIRPLPISMDHARQTTTLPFHHRDPFDRMLIAQARTEGLTLITADARISDYDVRLLMV
ncbi:MAG: type II toxin-antitoxin system VapC family toxin [Alphaproteobacteria bacterium]